VLLATSDALPSGKSQATLEFQTARDHRLVDVGTVNVGASMEMAGMGPMLGSVFVKIAKLALPPRKGKKGGGDGARRPAPVVVPSPESVRVDTAKVSRQVRERVPA